MTTLHADISTQSNIWIFHTDDYDNYCLLSSDLALCRNLQKSRRNKLRQYARYISTLRILVVFPSETLLNFSSTKHIHTPEVIYI